ncbi:polymeric immunoglobulin receptor-like [Spinachia spinachia]
MWKWFFTLCIALSCVSSAAGVIHVYGYAGAQVQVSCPYDPGYQSYEKYLCKDPCDYDDVLIKTTKPNENKYSTHDDRQNRVFFATISDLIFADTGKYWCGVTINGKDIYTEVKLKVAQDSCCDRSNKVQSYEESSVSISCQYESKHRDNLKYICRGNQPSTCLDKAIITSNGSQTGQLILTTDPVSRKFTVTMTGVTQSQSGSYLCGVHVNAGLDVFSAFELEVKEWCCVRSTKLCGVVGHPVTMQCPYPPKHKNNRKFLCRGDQRKDCQDVTSQSRFTLRDDTSSRSFLVIITELEAEDAGTYWCGSEPQWSAENYTNIQLSAVFQEPTSTATSAVSTLEPSSSQAKEVPGKASSPSVVLITLAVLLTLTIAIIASVIVCKYKCCKVQAPGVNMNRNQTKEDATEEAVEVANVYRNGDSALSPQLYEESVYQNYASAEDIYGNQNYIRTLQDQQHLG